MMKCNLMPNFDVDTKHSELKEIYRVIDINDELWSCAGFEFWYNSKEYTGVDIDHGKIDRFPWNFNYMKINQTLQIENMHGELWNFSNIKMNQA